MTTFRGWKGGGFGRMDWLDTYTGLLFRAVIVALRLLDSNSGWN